MSFFSREALRIFTLSSPDSVTVLRKDPACLCFLSQGDRCGSNILPSPVSGTGASPPAALFPEQVHSEGVQGCGCGCVWRERGEQTPALCSAPEHQPSVPCLSRGLLRAGISSLPLRASPLWRPCPTYSRRILLPAPSAGRGGESRSPLNLPVSLRHLSPCCSGPQTSLLPPPSPPTWTPTASGGVFHSCCASHPSGSQGSFQRGADQGTALLQGSPSPSASATCPLQACSSRNKQEAGECSVSAFVVWSRSSRWKGQGWDLGLRLAFGRRVQAREEPAGPVRCGLACVRTIYCCDE